MNKFRRNNKSSVFFLAVFFLAAMVCYFYPFSHTTYTLITNELLLVYPLIAVVAGVGAVTAFGFHNTHGKSFVYITCGLLSLLIGQVIWAFFQVTSRSVSSPSPVDLFHLLAYPLLFLGIFREIIYYRAMLKPEKIFALAVFTMVLMTIAFGIIVYPTLYSQGIKFGQIIAIGYNLGDVLLIVAIGYILLTIISIRGKLFNAWMYILLAGVFLFLGDILFSANSEQYALNVPTFKRIDILWIASYLFFAAGFIEMRTVIKKVQFKLKQLAE